MFDPRQALGLPRGSIRAILALLLVVAVIAMAFLGRLDAKELLPLASVVVTAYFVQKAAAGNG